MNIDSSDSLISPYKSIGLFLDNNAPYIYSAGNKSFMAVSTNHSYKIYKLPDLKIKLLGPHFPYKITSFVAHNELLYLACKNEILRVKFYHIEQKYTILPQHKSPLANLLLLGEVLLATDCLRQVILWDIKQSNPLFSFEVDYDILAIFHPMTYLNKIVIVGRRNMELYNIKAHEKIYDFTESLETRYHLVEKSIEITSIKQSPNLHIVALGFSNGLIALHNIQLDITLFTFQQQNAVLRLSFSHRELPLLASSDNFGNVNIWELNDRRLFSVLKAVHQSNVTCLEFLETELILLTGSGSDNSILQWKYDELEDNKFRLIRSRVGLKNVVKKLKFYGENGLHLITASNDPESEIRDISILNECMSINFSKKINKNMKKMLIDTESQYKLNEILDFDFALNREKEWGNLLTCHYYSCKPCLWSCEDHSIIKKTMEIVEDHTKKDDNLNFITAVSVTNCGNFGVLGFKNGLISKINMQSGVFQKEFHDKTNNGHKNAILSLKINNYNKLLVSFDEDSKLIFWDFFSGKLETIKNDFPSKISKMELSKTSQLFLLTFEDNSIELWDTYKKIKSRRFTGHERPINEAKFTPNNKFIVSCSMDQTMKIWDVLSGQLINDISLQKPIMTFDISDDGEMLASAFLDSKEINLWHILIGTKPWGNKEKMDLRFQSIIHDVSSSNREKYYGKASKINKDIGDKNQDQEIEDVFYKKFVLKKQEDKNQYNFTEIPEGKWLPLVHLDLIKEKNKPTILEKTEVKLPFFLDVEKKDDIRNEMKEHVLKETNEKSRIITAQREKFMNEMGSILDKYLENSVLKVNFKEIFEYLKSLSPSQLDYEFRKNLFGDMEKIKRMIEFFEVLLGDPCEFDIKQVYFKCFLNVSFYIFILIKLFRKFILFN